MFGFLFVCGAFCLFGVFFNLEQCLYYCVFSYNWILSTNNWKCMLTFQNIYGNPQRKKIVLNWVRVLKHGITERDEVPESLPWNVWLPQYTFRPWCLICLAYIKASRILRRIFSQKRSSWINTFPLTTWVALKNTSASCNSKILRSLGRN